MAKFHVQFITKAKKIQDMFVRTSVLLDEMRIH